MEIPVKGKGEQAGVGRDSLLTWYVGDIYEEKKKGGD